jgi:hypothetical protein
LWRITLTLLTLLCIVKPIYSQEGPESIHLEQSEYYKQFGHQPASFYDSVNNYQGGLKTEMTVDCQLQRIVFGFHPYWAGSDYLDYQWNLLSDLCYFAYEVNPQTGEPDSNHDWLTDPAIDSALAHGVRVHLCATIFAGHADFFSNPVARNTLVENLVSLVQQRGANGINMDIEAIPANLGDSVTSFMHELSLSLKQVMPGALVSIDLPAVNWGDEFDVRGMDPYVDYFFVMGYDYYWNSSSQAGPVSPLYSLTSGYNYSIARTISDYETSGLSPEKFILGVPYYGRQWKTESNNIPSPILENGFAMTYSNARNNGNYNEENYIWEPNSLSSCYIYFQNNNWFQCFIGLDRDLRKKYDQVNYRDLAGIGIWALGYDNGYMELWQAIWDKFTDCRVPVVFDTLYDSGGPAWNYYNDEGYTVTVDQGFTDSRYLTFMNVNLEDGNDSLLVYAGPDTTYSLLSALSGQSTPGTMVSDNGAFTIRFKSNDIQDAPGWMAVYHDGSLDVNEENGMENTSILSYPNPTGDFITVNLPESMGDHLTATDISGRVVYQQDIQLQRTAKDLKIDVSGLPAGIYIMKIMSGNRLVGSFKVIRK